MKQLKCWRKTNRVTNPKSMVVYENNDGNKLIFISKSKIFKNKPIRFSGVNKMGSIKDEYFKNTSEALQFTNSYMKKHDRC